jgi:hypothetical protein
MQTDLSTQLTMVRTASTRQAVQLAVVRTNNERDQALVRMLDEAVRAAPPPGLGASIDKLA